MSKLTRHLLGLHRTEGESYELVVDGAVRKTYQHKADLLKDLYEHAQNAIDGGPFDIIAQVDQGHVFTGVEVILNQDGYEALTTP